MRRVLLVPILVLALAATAALAYVTVTLRTTSAALERHVEGVRRANLLVSRLARLSTDATREVLAYRLRPSPDGAARMRSVNEQTERVVRELSTVDLSLRGNAIWRQLVSAREARARERERLVAAIDRGGEAHVRVLLDRWTLATDKTAALVADLSAFNLKRLAAVAEELHRTRSRALGWLVGVVAASALAVVAFAMLVDRRLVRPVQAITRTTRRVAEERVALQVPGRDRTDELGVLARAVTEMAGGLVHANAELARSLERRDEFLALAAHELRTPLSALKLHLEGCHRAWMRRAQPPTVRGVETALRHTGRLETLTRDLLTLAEIRDGRFKIAAQRTDLSAVVQEAADRAGGLMRSSGNSLETSIAPAVECDCDPARLGRVIASLLANAAEHAPGTLVSVRLEPRGGTTVLEVEDGGPGIPDAERSLVFEPYRKADRTERVRGLGLGLFIARQVVEAHGGTIAVGAGARGGTTCRIELPALRAGRGAATEGRAGAEPVRA
jgi:signal transduction histidine kinase